MVQSSLLLSWQGEPPAELQNAVRMAVSQMLSVALQQVQIAGVESSAGATRRLETQAMQWHVIFEVVFTKSVTNVGGEGMPAASGTGAQPEPIAAAALRNLEDLSSDPTPFLKTLENAMEELSLEVPVDGMQVVVTAPTMQHLTAQRSAGPWGTCSVDVAASSASMCMERRDVFCVSGANTSVQLRDASCLLLPELAAHRFCAQSDCSNQITEHMLFVANNQGKLEVPVLVGVSFGLVSVCSTLLAGVAWYRRRQRQASTKVAVADSEDWREVLPSISAANPAPAWQTAGGEEILMVESPHSC